MGQSEKANALKTEFYTFVRLLIYSKLRYHLSMEDYVFTAANLTKIFRGAYDYFENGKQYCTETFEVFEDFQDQFYYYKADVLGRAPTGEVLTIRVDYKLTTLYAPIAVRVEKHLGKRIATETYNFDIKENKMTYRFMSEDDMGQSEIHTKHKIHVGTPAICTSLLFLKSKRFQNTGINNFVSLVSNNNWNFKEPPVRRGISIERISGTPIDIFISNKRLKCVKYQMRSYDVGSEETADINEGEIPFLDLYLSKHLTIPYKIVDHIGNKLFQIKYFNYLVDSDK